MNKSFGSGTILAGAMIAAFGVQAASPVHDEAEVRAVAARQAETWNRHDARAYAELFTEDCNVVNVVGW